MEGGGREEKMEGGGGEEKENEKKKKKFDVECHIRLWGFGCGDLGVSIAALVIIHSPTHS
jgi:hypothetical protein